MSEAIVPCDIHSISTRFTAIMYSVFLNYKFGDVKVVFFKLSSMSFTRAKFGPITDLLIHANNILPSFAFDVLTTTNRSPIAHSAMHLISGINFLSHFASLAQDTLLMTSHSLIHLPPTHHSHPPSRIHCSIPGSKLTFSTNLFHHS